MQFLRVADCVREASLPQVFYGGAGTISRLTSAVGMFGGKNGHNYG